jgi:hypothetical protein
VRQPQAVTKGTSNSSTRVSRTCAAAPGRLRPAAASADAEQLQPASSSGDSAWKPLEADRRDPLQGQSPLPDHRPIERANEGEGIGAAVLRALVEAGSEPPPELLAAAARRIEEAGNSGIEIQAYVSILWRLAGRKAAHKELFEAVCDGLARQLRVAVDAAAAASALQALGRLRRSHAALLGAAAPLLSSAALRMPAVKVSALLQALSSVDVPDRLLLAALTVRLAAQGVAATLPPRELCRTVVALGAMDHHPGEGAAAALGAAALTAAPRMLPADVARVAWAAARLGLDDGAFFLPYAERAVCAVPQCAPADLALLSRAYARAGVAHGALFDAIGARAATCMERAEVTDVLRTLSAFQQLGLEPPRGLLDAAEACADARLARLSPQALSIALWAIAHQGRCTPQLLQTADEAVTARAAEFDGPQLARIAWAFAHLGHDPGSDIMRRAAEALERDGPALGEKAVANVLWALATLRRAPHPATLDAVALRLLPALSGFGPHALSTIAWSYATMCRGFSSLSSSSSFSSLPEFMTVLLDASVSRVADADPQSVWMLSWSCGTMGLCHTRCLATIEADCLQPGRLAAFQEQHLACLLWGMAKAKFVPGEPFLQAFADEAAPRAALFKPAELHSLLWALAALRRGPRPPLAAALAMEVATGAGEFDPSELVGCLWALAKMGCPLEGAAPVARAMEAAARAGAAAMPPRLIAQAVWSWAELGHELEEGAAAAVFATAERRAGSLDGHSLVVLLEVRDELMLFF